MNCFSRHASPQPTKEFYQNFKTSEFSSFGPNSCKRQDDGCRSASPAPRGESSRAAGGGGGGDPGRGGRRGRRGRRRGGGVVAEGGDDAGDGDLATARRRPGKSRSPVARGACAMCDALSVAGCAACAADEPCCAHAAACRETGELFRQAGSPLAASAFYDGPSSSPGRRRDAYEAYNAFDALYDDAYNDGYDAAAAESLYAGPAGEGYGDEQRGDSAFALADAQREAWLAELAAWNFFPSCAECEAGAGAAGCACEGCAGRRPRRASSCPPAIRLSAWHGGEPPQQAERAREPQRAPHARPAARDRPEACDRPPHRQGSGQGTSRRAHSHDQHHCCHHRQLEYLGCGSHGPFGLRGGFGQHGSFGHRGGFGHHGPFGHRWSFGFGGPFGHRGGFGFQGHRGGFKHSDPFGHRGGFGHHGPFGHRGGFGFHDLFGHRGGFGHHGLFGHKGGLQHHGHFGHLGTLGHRGGFALHGPFGHRGGFGFHGMFGHRGGFGHHGPFGHRGGFGHHGPFGHRGGFGHHGPFGHRGGFGHHGPFGHRGGFGHHGMFINNEGSDYHGMFGHHTGFDHHRGSFAHPGSFGSRGHSEHSGDFRHCPCARGGTFHNHGPFSERGGFAHEHHGDPETHEHRGRHESHGPCKRRKHCKHHRCPFAAHTCSNVCSPCPGEDSLSEPSGARSARSHRRSGCGCVGQGRIDSRTATTAARTPAMVEEEEEEEEGAAAAAAEEEVPEAQAERVAEMAGGVPRRPRLPSWP